jgi:glycosyltransferase involved in cell wall biosynthesis
MKVVVDALQVAPNYSGLGRQVQSIGRELARVPEDIALELRCAAETLPLLAPSFPTRTAFSTPIGRARPRLGRIVRQQVAAPARDRDSTLLVCLGDQAPVWGRARVLLAVNDVRRLTHPETSAAAERRYYRWIVPRAVRHAAVVATISEFSRGEIRRVLGVDARVVADHPPPRVEMPAGRADGHILVVGAIRPYKGIDTLVEAVARMNEHPRVVVVGEGAMRAAGVEFTGWVNEERLDELYRTAAATVSASRYEGYGLPVAESLGYGLPTIASDIPAHREVAGDAAFYFPPGDPAALADVLRRRRDGMGERALERSRELAGRGPRWADVIMEALA